MAHDYVTHDTIPVLDTTEHPCPIDLPQYRDVVLDRFANPAICDTNQRVAMDGFSKIPGFIAPTIRQRLARGEGIESVAMLPALFLAFLQRWHLGQLSYAYQDQAMDPAVAHAMCQAGDPVAVFCADRLLWGDLAGDARLTDAVRRAYARVQAFAAEHVRQPPL
jgi:D-arabinitol 4-dehydrogenase